MLGNGQAVQYGVGVGRPGFTWAGTHSITMKREWPDWRPPAAMLKRRPDLPRYMKGGPDNPLGARAMYIGSTIYRIHGSNEPETIGEAVSSGCIRMTNEDVIDLYSRAKVGARAWSSVPALDVMAGSSRPCRARMSFGGKGRARNPYPRFKISQRCASLDVAVMDSGLRCAAPDDGEVTLSRDNPLAASSSR